MSSTDPSGPTTGPYRLPTEPYPGLRPFLDHESALLQGRAPQVQEIIDRLGRTRFVAVLGGSGSGKSSIIRAGVVPRLRGSGIAGAGDYWVPVVCTPGTAMAAPGGGKAPSPVDRLAFKLAQALQPLASPGQTQERLEEIAAVFRQGAGFARLVDGYHDELRAQGPATESARFLFVIDQFEELFHPNNRTNEDARCMVEAVIAHFFNPHERCYVVATMRSEHLADCAAYLELPQAINQSLYLVRRLDENDLRDAIVGPAKVFLRLCQRAARRAPTRVLPADVTFDDAVVQRLVRDATRIAEDPDHLPLLQHVLARCWAEARRREGVAPGGVPARVTWADLAAAVWPALEADDAAAPPVALAEQPELNTLRVSLDRCAQAEYERRSTADRVVLDQMLRELGFRDPNNGLYFQQRLTLEGMDLFPGDPDPQQRLHALLEHGFLDGAHYLFWDREDPRQTTLKVSHESFIRGWEHFRRLVDHEAERFEEFLSILRKCVAWRPRHDPSLLLEASDLKRLDSFELGPVLADEQARAGWFRVLDHYRSGDRVADVEPIVGDYVVQSRRLRQWEEEQELENQKRLVAAEKDRERAEETERHNLELAGKNRELQVAQGKLKRKSLGLLGWAMVAMLGLLFVGYVLFARMQTSSVQEPALSGTFLYSYARLLLEQSESARLDATVGGTGQTLRVVLQAANAVRDAAEHGRALQTALADIGEAASVDATPAPAPGSASQPDNAFTTQSSRDSPRQRRRDAALTFHLASSEPRVNASLRRLLTTGIWTSPAVDEKDQIQPVHHPWTCQLLETGVSLKGIAMLDNAGYENGRRGVFAAHSPGSEFAVGEISFHRVLDKADDQSRGCRVGRAFWSVPNDLDPLILVDARVRYLALSTGAARGSSPAVTLYEIQWETDEQDELVDPRLKLRTPTPFTDDRAFKVVRSAFKIDRPEALARIAMVPTWRTPAGFGFEAGDQTYWSLINEGLQWKSGKVPSSNWTLLESPNPEGTGPCGRLQKIVEDPGRDKQLGFRSETLVYPQREAGDVLCIVIKRGIPRQASGPQTRVEREIPPQTSDPHTREQVLVSLYDARHMHALQAKFGDPMALPPALATVVASERRKRADEGCTRKARSAGSSCRPPDDWYIGVSGDEEGWIAVGNEADRAHARTPLTTEALHRLGCDVLKVSLSPEASSVSAGPDPCGVPRSKQGKLE